MPKRIIILYSCAHTGEKLPPIEDKFWNTTPPLGRVCWCQNDPEKNKPMPTPMDYKVEITDSKPE